MKVRLITHTPDPDAIVGAAARSCRSSKSVDEILKDGRIKLQRSLSVCVEHGHDSVIEHASFTFSVEGLSRACTHELVRHRIASYSQQSQRAVKLGENYIVPPTIAGKKDEMKAYADLMKNTWKTYNDFVIRGIPVEDARYILPTAAATNIVVTMNARSLINFFRLRCCTHAQWEIRNLAYEMLKQVKKIAPTIFTKVGPSCVTDNTCLEDDESCSLFTKNVRPKKELIS